MKTTLVLSFVLAACGGEGSKKPVSLIDAPKAIDAAPVNCLLPSSMGAITPGAQEAHSAMGETETAPSNYYLYADLNTDPMPDVLLVDLYKGYGAFENGWPTAAQLIQLTGDEADYATCGACVLAMTDFTEEGPTGDPYIATAGTMDLTMVGPSKVKGTLTDVKFTHVTIDEDTAASTPHIDGCTSMLGSVAFEATPMPPDPMPLDASHMRMRLRLDRVNGVTTRSHQ